MYRVHDGGTQKGHWWSFENPANMTRDEYRKANVICEEWNKLSLISVATLAVGAVIVVGTGQSARCKNWTVLKESDHTQVFVPNMDDLKTIRLAPNTLRK